ncbi:hypothetical protein AB0F81_31170 [Actinoplanes sp. NPDC024001]|uniref:hypothetical protein n=1 Tax=Actinoplanes sp. NPDC024001 TaxID=3154598 RepID=UPI00340CFD25
MTGAEFEGVDLDLLADYIGGALLGTPDEERVAALVADDPAWRSAYDELAPALAAVGTTLLDLPPEPMPAELADRLDTMFRTTAPAAAGESAEAVPARVLDLEEHRRDRAPRAGGRRAPRWVKPVAVAAGVLAFAGFGLRQITAETTADSAQSTGAGGAAFNAEAAPMIASPPEQILHSDTDYRGPSLGKSARETVEQPHTVADSGASGAKIAGGGLERLLASDVLLSCLEVIARENAGGPLSVLFVDYARYEGAPALIVQFTAANGGWIWAVGPECGASGAGAAALTKVPVR